MGSSTPRLRDRGRLLWGVVLFLAGAGLVLGCGRGSFVGRQYDDLTAYYNTFYNANQAFEAGLESANASGGDIDRTRYVSVFPTPQGGVGEQSFEKAIQKSADLLRQHPNSKWVDDALLLIGRARYYQQNYVGAAQKFREVIALGDDREGEARFRLAQTLLAADRPTEAADALRAGLDTERDYGTWTARMRLARGVLSVRRQNWDEAEQALVQGVQGPLPDDAGARGAFLLGQVRETQEQFEGAAEAYRRALEYDPAYSLAFAARLSALEMQGLQGAPGRALEQLESLERGDNTNEMRGEIARVRAQLYLEQGRPDRAKQVLTTLLRSEETPRGTVLGRVHYDLATLYRDRDEDFTRAAAHFDTAATNLSTGPQDGATGEPGQVLPRAPSDVSEEADRFRGLATHAEAVARMDSLLRLGRLPRDEFQAAVEEIRQRRLAQREQDAEARRDRQQQFRGGGRAGAQPSTPRSSQQNAVQTRGSDAGFLFHRDPTLVQQGRRQFEQTWGERPLADNWRRAEALEGSSAPTAAEEQGGAPQAASSPSSAPATRVVDVSAVPRDSASRAEMENRRAVARYRLANALYRDANRPDSAETWYIKILGQDWEHPVAKQALYGLAQAHRAQGDTTAAREAYHYIVQEYPSTPYAERARKQLGLEPRDSASAPKTQTQADSAYAQAYAAWQRGAHETALKGFLAVADTYAETPEAPRALLAAGIVYQRSAPHDTSGGMTARFERYADSLAQSTVRAEASPDFSKGAPPTASASARPDPDTTSASASSPSSVDSTTAAGSPRRVAQPVDTVQEDSNGPLRAVSDSTAAGDQKRPADSSGGGAPPRAVAARDTTAPAASSAPPDTTVPDRTGGQAPPDSVAPPARPRSDSTRPFEVLLAHISDQYSGTPEAERAQALLAQLNEQRRATPTQTVPDSVRSTAGSQPRSPTDSAAVSQRPRSRTPRSTGSAADTSEQRTARPSAEGPEETPRRDASATSGHWTIVVASRASRPAAEKIASTYEARFDSVQVVSSTVDGARRHRVTIGQYPSQEAAERLLSERDSIPSDAWLLERP